MRRTVHPAADIFPMLDEDAYQRLKADIEENGMKEPLVYYQGQLVDGRNRLRACKELRIDPSECELEEDEDPVAFVLSANLHRRQLRTSQKAMCAARMATLPNHRPKNSANLRSYTCEQAAELFGVSARAIENARKVLRDGCTELKALCEEGKSVATACKFIDEFGSKKEQQPMAREGWQAIREYVANSLGPRARSASASVASPANLPEEAPEEFVAEVEAWLERQDDRPFFERFKALWTAADDTGKAAIRAFIMDEDD